MAGRIAIDLVIITLFQTGNLISKNPSITNCPAYVPVIVDAYPAASNPTPQIIDAAFPNVTAKASEAFIRLSLTFGSL